MLVQGTTKFGFALILLLSNAALDAQTRDVQTLDTQVATNVDFEDFFVDKALRVELYNCGDAAASTVVLRDWSAKRRLPG